MGEAILGELLKPELWIGVDQSYSGFGLVMLDNDGYTVKLWKFKNSGSESGRLYEIYETLRACFQWCEENYSRVYMAMEGYAHGSRFNREKLGELGGIVKLAWYSINGTDPTVVPPTVLKKYVTGKGTASKDLMVSTVNDRWAVGIKDNNVADAIGLAHYLKDKHGDIQEDL
jgi:Holliday junction resolvasome RuvABC endonuclease subunit